MCDAVPSDAVVHSCTHDDVGAFSHGTVAAPEASIAVVDSTVVSVTS